MLKNRYSNISWYLFLWYLYHNVICHLVKSCKNPALKFSDTKEHLCSLFSYFQFQWVQLKWTSALKFNFSFWCYGSYISVLGNFPIPFKSIGKEIFNAIVLTQFFQFSYWYNEMSCMRTTQNVQSNLHVFTVSVNYFEYRKALANTQP